MRSAGYGFLPDFAVLLRDSGHLETLAYTLESGSPHTSLPATC